LKNIFVIKITFDWSKNGQTLKIHFVTRRVALTGSRPKTFILSSQHAII